MTVTKPITTPFKWETTAAEVARLGIDHVHREADRNGGINRISASAQHFAPGRARDVVARGHHGMRPAL